MIQLVKIFIFFLACYFAPLLTFVIFSKFSDQINEIVTKHQKK